MGVVRDVTVDNLVTAVGNIDTSSLAQDSTLQDVVTAISNISGGSDPVTNTTVNTLGKDTTLQTIAAAINSLSGAISPAASNVTFDNTGTGLNASNVQRAITEICTDLIQTKTYTASYTAGGNASITLTANDFNAVTPSGYTPIGISDFASQSTSVAIRGVYGRATGTSAMMVMRNLTTASVTAAAYVTILYIKSLFI